jgi:hypothetical protein
MNYKEPEDKLSEEVDLLIEEIGRQLHVQSRGKTYNQFRQV